MASLVADDWKEVFYSKKALTSFLLSGKCNNSIIVATNLSFDFFGSIKPEGFGFLFRGSSLLSARTYIYNNCFNRKSNGHKNRIEFVDTMNYIQASVEKLGKILKIPKLKKPGFLGKLPKNKAERDEILKYNLRDSLVSKEALKMLYKSFEKLGATPKLTIASTSMSLFKNKYLKDVYHRMPEPIIRTLFKGYYGGRTEAFSRGEFSNYFYYDFNSLYPDCMLNELPDPNTWRECHEDSLHYINYYSGMSDVIINVPKSMDIPPLPLRFNKKLIFPTGRFRGYYTHLEINECLKHGIIVEKVYHTIYFLKTCKPFEGFVTDLYTQRFKQKSKAMEKVIKMLLTNLYGKFAQKYEGRDNLINMNDYTAEELNKFPYLEPMNGCFARIQEYTPPAVFCIPIWSAYITAYGRLKLWGVLKESCPLYCDTDSIITKKEYVDSMKLGELKREHFIKKGFIVKPKFYAFEDHIRVKGVGKKMVLKDFWQLIIEKKISYTKFIKLRESIRRKMTVNEVIKVTKKFNLEDNKRNWEEPFNHSMQFSTPLNVQIKVNNLREHEISTQMEAVKLRVVE